MQSRKRRRTTIVCNVCKARKVRCDRKLPCSSCVRHKTPHLCVYDEFPKEDSEYIDPASTSPSTDTLNYAGYLSRTVETHTDKVYLAPTTPAKILANFTSVESVIGVNPIGAPNDIINFYLGYSSISFDPETMEQVNHGPFTWHSIIRSDPGLSEVSTFMLDIKPSSNGKIPSELSHTVTFNQDRIQLQVLNRIRKLLMQRFDSQKVGPDWGNLPLGLTFNDPNSDNVNIGNDERLLGILPPRNILWSHIDRFFRVLYPFYPYLDERLFRETIARILGPPSPDASKVTNVHATKRMDYAEMGILCILLRLSYLSLISNNIQHNHQHKQKSEENDNLRANILLMYPIGIEFIDFSRICLNKYQVYNKSSISMLQLLVFTRIYLEVCPEDSEGPARDLYQVNNGVLLQVANSVGLNREPDKFTDTLNDARTNNIRRKLWMFIQFRDVINSLKFGSPYVSAAFLSDTKFPYLDEHNANCEEDGVDSLVDKAHRPIEQLLPLMRSAIQNVLSIDKGTLVADLLQHLNNLEVYLYEHYGTLRDVDKLFMENSDESKVHLMRIPYYLPVQMFIVVVYFRLYLYYENSSPNLAFFYCKKFLAIIVLELLPFIDNMLGKPHPFFDYASQLVTNPQLEYFMHRSVGFMGALNVRLGNQIMEAKYKGVDDLFTTRLKFLMRCLSRCSKSCLIWIHKMSHRYCYAWRIAITFTYIFRSLVSEGLYDTMRSRTIVGLPPLNFTDNQVRDLVVLLLPFADKNDGSELSIYWKIVEDVIKLGKKSGDGVLFNPQDTKVVFADLPRLFEDLEDRSLFEGPGEFDIDPLWFPVFDTKELHTTMGTLFDGPQSYFEAFNDVNMSVDNYSMGSAL